MNLELCWKNLQFTSFCTIFGIIKLSETLLLYLQFSHLFDNESTVFFAIFMGVWGKYTVHCLVCYNLSLHDGEILGLYSTKVS